MSLSSIIGQASRGADLYFVFRFLRLLTMKYESTDAYKFGIIDKKGKALRKSADLTSTKEKASYTMLHRMVFKIRRLMEKIPGGRFVNYAAALFLLKEQKDARIWTDDGYMKSKLLEFLETDWKADAKFLKEEVDNMDKKSFKSFLSENKTIEESQELQAMMALDDAGIEAVIDKKGKIVIDKKDKKKAEKALKKSFKKGGIPEIQYEEVELEEAVNLKKLKKEYEDNEDKNNHTENYLLLAKAFGSSSDVKKVQEIMKRNQKQGSTSKSDMDWMYKNINPYYDKIRNEEVEVAEAVLDEALKPRDKAVIDAFYSRKGNLASNLLSVEGGKLTKMGMGGQEIAIWKNDKIVINAKMDVKSTEEIVRYMKKSIPSGVFEEVEIEESNELQAIMALDDVGIEASINKKDQVVVKKKDLKKAEAALKKSFKKGGAPELHGEEVKIGEKLEKESYGSFITAAAKAKKEGKKTFMMGGKKYPVTIKQKISAAYEEAEVEEAKLYAAKGTAYPATIDTLKMIVKDKQNQTIMFKDGKAMVDLFTASAMTQVYDALKKPEIKKSFEKMILDKAGFLKAQGFAMKMISGK